MTTAAQLRKRVIVLAVLTAGAVALAVGAWFALSPHATLAAGATDMNGNPVLLDPGVKPSQESNAVADIGETLEAPSVSLDVPLGELSEVEGEITPPGFTSAYLVRNRGVNPSDASQGTVYVVMHSLRNGGVGPGNSLFNVDDGSSQISAGETITVSGVDYTVISHEIIGKKDLPSHEELWSPVPDRLVVITCLQSPDGKLSTSNFVLIAERPNS